MKKFSFGILTTFKTGRKPLDIRLAKKSDRHTAKSLAGTLFHLEAVKSVCVFDRNGVSHFYLKKLPCGGVLKEELD